MNFSLSLRHVLLLSWEEARDIVWQLKSLVLICLFGLAVALFGWAAPSFNNFEQPFTLDLMVFNLQAPGVNDFKLLLENFGFSDADQLASQAWQLPSILWIVQIVLLGFYPLLLSIMSADAITRDIQRGTLRVILSRSSRCSYFTAKLLTHFLILFLLCAAALLIAIVVTTIKGALPSAMPVSRLALSYLAISSCYILACVALTLLVSASARRVKDALLRIQLVWTLILLLAPLTASYSLLGPRSLIGYVLPVGELAFSAAAIQLCWAAACGTGALWIFSKKEV